MTRSSQVAPAAAYDPIAPILQAPPGRPFVVHPSEPMASMEGVPDDIIDGANLDVRKQVNFLPVPAAVQVGGRSKTQLRDVRRGKPAVAEGLPEHVPELCGGHPEAATARPMKIAIPSTPTTSAAA